MKKSNNFVWLLFIALPFLIHCKIGSTQKTGLITFIDKPVPNTELNRDSCYPDAYCERRIRYFNFDADFYLDEKFSDSPYVLDTCFKCSLLNLVVNRDTINLDAIYRSQFKNRSVWYMAGFVEGSYFILNDIVHLKLIFINLQTNTSRDTSHEYIIVYDKKKAKLISAEVHSLAQND